VLNSDAIDAKLTCRIDSIRALDVIVSSDLYLSIHVTDIHCVSKNANQLSNDRL